LPDQPTIFNAKDLPAPGGVLAVSLEPPSGSPTGLPTGPVLFQGKVIRPL
jgi:anti-sigma-K factor RskA